MTFVSGEKRLFKKFGFNHEGIIQSLRIWSLRAALPKELKEIAEKLRRTIPDISRQYSAEEPYFDECCELKLRAQQAFQCSLMLKALEVSSGKKLTVVDIGDSAGSHMLYLKELTKGRLDVDTISVNLDPRAIEKIRKRGLRAILCRAEDLDLGEQKVDLFTSFEMIEHLHNPALFLRRLARKSECGRIVLTVPYLRTSRVGLYSVRGKKEETVFAEKEHIFELNPKDWELLFLHSGWQVTYSQVYYQYPKKIPVISNILGWLWRKTDFEGFWGAILTKDTSFSDLYQDWES